MEVGRRRSEGANEEERFMGARDREREAEVRSIALWEECGGRSVALDDAVDGTGASGEARVATRVAQLSAVGGKPHGMLGSFVQGLNCKNYISHLACSSIIYCCFLTDTGIFYLQAAT